ncbi:MAG TPA: CYTH domain-containing protein [Gammaproteobacteria bacterium]|nr:CYTH domain-containing protein [Gammaproteobacteria bacterium]
MAIEIERTFLVRDERWRQDADGGEYYSQGYLSSDPQNCIRVRIAGERAWLGIKRATSALRRLEYEYPIPLQDAREILEQIVPRERIDKWRYHVPWGKHLWEIDVFDKANAGLVVAEIELQDEDEDFERPPWLGQEVSDDPRYYNMNLARNPYPTWK